MSESILLIKPTEPHQRVKIRQEHGTMSIIPVGEVINDLDMFALRRPVNPRVMLDNLSGNGHIFANLGLSAVITTQIMGKSFLLLVRRGEKNAKLLSEYIPAHKLLDPWEALVTGLSEEILATDVRNESVVRGTIDGEHLSCPFPTLTYADGPFELSTRGCDYHLDGLFDGTVLINQTMPRAKPRLFFCAPTNSAQLVYSISCQIEPDLLQYVTLHHTEDRRTTQDAQGKLETIKHPNGILLVELSSGNLTNRVFTLQSGRLIEFSGSLALSEAFTAKTNAIAGAVSVDLQDAM